MRKLFAITTILLFILSPIAYAAEANQEFAKDLREDNVQPRFQPIDYTQDIEQEAETEKILEADLTEDEHLTYYEEAEAEDEGGQLAYRAEGKEVKEDEDRAATEIWPDVRVTDAEVNYAETDDTIGWQQAITAQKIAKPTVSSFLDADDRSAIDPAAGFRDVLLDFSRYINSAKIMALISALNSLFDQLFGQPTLEESIQQTATIEAVMEGAPATELIEETALTITSEQQLIARIQTLITELKELDAEIAQPYEDALNKYLAYKEAEALIGELYALFDKISAEGYDMSGIDQDLQNAFSLLEQIRQTGAVSRDILAQMYLFLASFSKFASEYAVYNMLDGMLFDTKLDVKSTKDVTLDYLLSLKSALLDIALNERNPFSAQAKQAVSLVERLIGMYDNASGLTDNAQPILDKLNGMLAELRGNIAQYLKQKQDEMYNKYRLPETISEEYIGALKQFLTEIIEQEAHPGRDLAAGILEKVRKLETKAAQENYAASETQQLRKEIEADLEKLIELDKQWKEARIANPLITNEITPEYLEEIGEFARGIAATEDHPAASTAKELLDIMSKINLAFEDGQLPDNNEINALRRQFEEKLATLVEMHRAYLAGAYTEYFDYGMLTEDSITQQHLRSLLAYMREIISDKQNPGAGTAKECEAIINSILSKFDANGRLPAAEDITSLLNELKEKLTQLQAALQEYYGEFGQDLLRSNKEYIDAYNSLAEDLGGYLDRESLLYDEEVAGKAQQIIELINELAALFDDQYRIKQGAEEEIERIAAEINKSLEQFDDLMSTKWDEFNRKIQQSNKEFLDSLEEIADELVPLLQDFPEQELIAEILELIAEARAQFDKDYNLLNGAKLDEIITELNDKLEQLSELQLTLAEQYDEKLRMSNEYFLRDIENLKKDLEAIEEIEMNYDLAQQALQIVTQIMSKYDDEGNIKISDISTEEQITSEINTLIEQLKALLSEFSEEYYPQVQKPAEEETEPVEDYFAMLALQIPETGEEMLIRSVRNIRTLLRAILLDKSYEDYWGKTQQLFDYFQNLATTTLYSNTDEKITADTAIMTQLRELVFKAPAIEPKTEQLLELVKEQRARSAQEIYADLEKPQQILSDAIDRHQVEEINAETRADYTAKCGLCTATALAASFMPTVSIAGFKDTPCKDLETVFSSPAVSLYPFEVKAKPAQTMSLITGAVPIAIAKDETVFPNIVQFRKAIPENRDGDIFLDFTDPEPDTPFNFEEPGEPMITPQPPPEPAPEAAEEKPEEPVKEEPRFPPIAERKPICGDRTVSGTEECENDDQCPADQRCEVCRCVDLSAAYGICGNGITEAQEQCEYDTDCANNERCENCRCAAYEMPTCGNGKLEAGETCETGISCPPMYNCIQCNCEVEQWPLDYKPEEPEEPKDSYDNPDVNASTDICIFFDPEKADLYDFSECYANIEEYRFDDVDQPEYTREWMELPAREAEGFGGCEPYGYSIPGIPSTAPEDAWPPGMPDLHVSLKPEFEESYGTFMSWIRTVPVLYLANLYGIYAHLQGKSEGLGGIQNQLPIDSPSKATLEEQSKRMKELGGSGKLWFKQMSTLMTENNPYYYQIPETQQSPDVGLFDHWKVSLELLEELKWPIRDEQKEQIKKAIELLKQIQQMLLEQAERALREIVGGSAEELLGAGTIEELINAGVQRLQAIIPGLPPGVDKGVEQKNEAMNLYNSLAILAKLAGISAELPHVPLAGGAQAQARIEESELNRLGLIGQIEGAGGMTIDELIAALERKLAELEQEEEVLTVTGEYLKTFAFQTDACEYIRRSGMQMACVPSGLPIRNVTTELEAAGSLFAKDYIEFALSTRAELGFWDDKFRVYSANLAQQIEEAKKEDRYEWGEKEKEQSAEIKFQMRKFAMTTQPPQAGEPAGSVPVKGLPPEFPDSLAKRFYDTKEAAQQFVLAATEKVGPLEGKELVDLETLEGTIEDLVLEWSILQSHKERVEQFLDDNAVDMMSDGRHGLFEWNIPFPGECLVLKIHLTEGGEILLEDASLIKNENYLAELGLIGGEDLIKQLNLQVVFLDIIKEEFKNSIEDALDAITEYRTSPTAIIHDEKPREKSLDPFQLANIKEKIEEVEKNYEKYVDEAYKAGNLVTLAYYILSQANARLIQAKMGLHLLELDNLHQWPYLPEVKLPCEDCGTWVPAITTGAPSSVLGAAAPPVTASPMTGTFFAETKSESKQKAETRKETKQEPKKYLYNPMGTVTGNDIAYIEVKSTTPTAQFTAPITGNFAVTGMTGLSLWAQLKQDDPGVAAGIMTAILAGRSPEFTKRTLIAAYGWSEEYFDELFAQALQDNREGWEEFIRQVGEAEWGDAPVEGEEWEEYVRQHRPATAGTPAEPTVPETAPTEEQREAQTQPEQPATTSEGEGRVITPEPSQPEVERIAPQEDGLICDLCPDNAAANEAKLIAALMRRGIPEALIDEILRLISMMDSPAELNRLIEELTGPGFEARLTENVGREEARKIIDELTRLLRGLGGQVLQSPPDSEPVAAQRAGPSWIEQLEEIRRRYERLCESQPQLPICQRLREARFWESLFARARAREESEALERRLTEARQRNDPNALNESLKGQEEEIARLRRELIGVTERDINQTNTARIRELEQQIAEKERQLLNARSQYGEPDEEPEIIELQTELSRMRELRRRLERALPLRTALDRKVELERRIEYAQTHQDEYAEERAGIIQDTIRRIRTILEEEALPEPVRRELEAQVQALEAMENLERSTATRIRTAGTIEEAISEALQRLQEGNIDEETAQRIITELTRQRAAIELRRAELERQRDALDNPNNPYARQLNGIPEEEGRAERITELEHQLTGAQTQQQRAEIMEQLARVEGARAHVQRLREQLAALPPSSPDRTYLEAQIAKYEQQIAQNPLEALNREIARLEAMEEATRSVEEWVRQSAREQARLSEGESAEFQELAENIQRAEREITALEGQIAALERQLEDETLSEYEKNELRTELGILRGSLNIRREEIEEMKRTRNGMLQQSREQTARSIQQRIEEIARIEQQIAETEDPYLKQVLNFLRKQHAEGIVRILVQRYGAESAGLTRDERLRLLDEAVRELQNLPGSIRVEAIARFLKIAEEEIAALEEARFRASAGEGYATPEDIESYLERAEAEAEDLSEPMEEAMRDILQQRRKMLQQMRQVRNMLIPPTDPQIAQMIVGEEVNLEGHIAQLIRNIKGNVEGAREALQGAIRRAFELGVGQRIRQIIEQALAQIPDARAQLQAVINPMLESGEALTIPISEIIERAITQLREGYNPFGEDLAQIYERLEHLAGAQEIEAQRAELEGRLSPLRRQLQQTRSELEEKENELGELGEGVDEQKAAELNARISTLRAEATRLGDQIEAARKTAEGITGNLEALRGMLREMSPELMKAYLEQHAQEYINRINLGETTAAEQAGILINQISEQMERAQTLRREISETLSQNPGYIEALRAGRQNLLPQELRNKLAQLNNIEEALKLSSYALLKLLARTTTEPHLAGGAYLTNEQFTAILSEPNIARMLIMLRAQFGTNAQFKELFDSIDRTIRTRESRAAGIRTRLAEAGAGGRITEYRVNELKQAFEQAAQQLEELFGEIESLNSFANQILEMMASIDPDSDEYGSLETMLNAVIDRMNQAGKDLSEAETAYRSGISSLQTHFFNEGDEKRIAELSPYLSTVNRIIMQRERLNTERERIRIATEVGLSTQAMLRKLLPPDDPRWALVSKLTDLSWEEVISVLGDSLSEQERYIARELGSRLQQETRKLDRESTRLQEEQTTLLQQTRIIEAIRADSDVLDAIEDILETGGTDEVGGELAAIIRDIARKDPIFLMEILQSSGRDIAQSIIDSAIQIGQAFVGVIGVLGGMPGSLDQYLITKLEQISQRQAAVTARLGSRIHLRAQLLSALEGGSVEDRQLHLARSLQRALIMFSDGDYQAGLSWQEAAADGASQTFNDLIQQICDRVAADLRRDSAPEVAAELRREAETHIDRTMRARRADYAWQKENGDDEEATEMERMQLQAAGQRAATQYAQLIQEALAEAARQTELGNEALAAREYQRVFSLVAKLSESILDDWETDVQESEDSWTRADVGQRDMLAKLRYLRSVGQAFETAAKYDSLQALEQAAETGDIDAVGALETLKQLEKVYLRTVITDQGINPEALQYITNDYFQAIELISERIQPSLLEGFLESTFASPTFWFDLASMGVAGIGATRIVSVVWRFSSLLQKLSEATKIGNWAARMVIEGTAFHVGTSTISSVAGLTGLRTHADWSAQGFWNSIRFIGMMHILGSISRGILGRIAGAIAGSGTKRAWLAIGIARSTRTAGELASEVGLFTIIGYDPEQDLAQQVAHNMAMVLGLKLKGVGARIGAVKQNFDARRALEARIGRLRVDARVQRGRLNARRAHLRAAGLEPQRIGELKKEIGDLEAALERNAINSQAAKQILDFGKKYGFKNLPEFIESVMEGSTTSGDLLKLISVHGETAIADSILQRTINELVKGGLMTEEQFTEFFRNLQSRPVLIEMIMSGKFFELGLGPRDILRFLPESPARDIFEIKGYAGETTRAGAMHALINGVRARGIYESARRELSPTYPSARARAIGEVRSALEAQGYTSREAAEMARTMSNPSLTPRETEIETRKITEGSERIEGTLEEILPGERRAPVTERLREEIPVTEVVEELRVPEIVEEIAVREGVGRLGEAAVEVPPRPAARYEPRPELRTSRSAQTIAAELSRYTSREEVRSELLRPRPAVGALRPAIRPSAEVLREIASRPATELPREILGVEYKGYEVIKDGGEFYVRREGKLYRLSESEKLELRGSLFNDVFNMLESVREGRIGPKEIHRGSREIINLCEILRQLASPLQGEAGLQEAYSALRSDLTDLKGKIIEISKIKEGIPAAWPSTNEKFGRGNMPIKVFNGLYKGLWSFIRDNGYRQLSKELLGETPGKIASLVATPAARAASASVARVQDELSTAVEPEALREAAESYRAEIEALPGEVREEVPRAPERIVTTAIARQIASGAKVDIFTTASGAKVTALPDRTGFAVLREGKRYIIEVGESGFVRVSEWRQTAEGPRLVAGRDMPVSAEYFRNTFGPEAPRRRLGEQALNEMMLRQIENFVSLYETQTAGRKIGREIEGTEIVRERVEEMLRLEVGRPEAERIPTPEELVAGVRPGRVKLTEEGITVEPLEGTFVPGKRYELPDGEIGEFVMYSFGRPVFKLAENIYWFDRKTFRSTHTFLQSVIADMVKREGQELLRGITEPEISAAERAKIEIERIARGRVTEPMRYAAMERALQAEIRFGKISRELQPRRELVDRIAEMQNLLSAGKLRETLEYYNERLTQEQRLELQDGMKEVTDLLRAGKRTEAEQALARILTERSAEISEGVRSQTLNAVEVMISAKEAYERIGVTENEYQEYSARRRAELKDIPLGEIEIAARLPGEVSVRATRWAPRATQTQIEWYFTPDGRLIALSKGKELSTEQGAQEAINWYKNVVRRLAALGKDLGRMRIERTEAELVMSGYARSVFDWAARARERLRALEARGERGPEYNLAREDVAISLEALKLAATNEAIRAREIYNNIKENQAILESDRAAARDVVEEFESLAEEILELEKLTEERQEEVFRDIIRLESRIVETYGYEEGAVRLPQLTSETMALLERRAQVESFDPSVASEELSPMPRERGVVLRASLFGVDIAAQGLGKILKWAFYDAPAWGLGKLRELRTNRRVVQEQLRPKPLERRLEEYKASTELRERAGLAQNDLQIKPALTMLENVGLKINLAERRFTNEYRNKLREDIMKLESAPRTRAIEDRLAQMRRELEGLETINPEIVAKYRRAITDFVAELKLAEVEGRDWIRESEAENERAMALLRELGLDIFYRPKIVTEAGEITSGDHAAAIRGPDGKMRVVIFDFQSKGPAGHVMKAAFEKLLAADRTRLESIEDFGTFLSELNNLMYFMMPGAKPATIIEINPATSTIKMMPSGNHIIRARPDGTIELIKGTSATSLGYALDSRTASRAREEVIQEIPIEQIGEIITYSDALNELPIIVRGQGKTRMIDLGYIMEAQIMQIAGRGIGRTTEFLTNILLESRNARSMLTKALEMARRAETLEAKETLTEAERTELADAQKYRNALEGIILALERGRDALDFGEGTLYDKVQRLLELSIESGILADDLIALTLNRRSLTTAAEKLRQVQLFEEMLELPPAAEMPARAEAAAPLEYFMGGIPGGYEAIRALDKIALSRARAKADQMLELMGKIETLEKKEYAKMTPEEITDLMSSIRTAARDRKLRAEIEKRWNKEFLDYIQKNPTEFLRNPDIMKVFGRAVNARRAELTYEAGMEAPKLEIPEFEIIEEARRLPPRPSVDRINAEFSQLPLAVQAKIAERQSGTQRVILSREEFLTGYKAWLEQEVAQGRMTPERMQESLETEVRARGGLREWGIGVGPKEGISFATSLLVGGAVIGGYRIARFVWRTVRNILSRRAPQSSLASERDIETFRTMWAEAEARQSTRAEALRTATMLLEAHADAARYKGEINKDKNKMHFDEGEVLLILTSSGPRFVRIATPGAKYGRRIANAATFKHTIIDSATGKPLPRISEAVLRRAANRAYDSAEMKEYLIDLIMPEGTVFEQFGRQWRVVKPEATETGLIFEPLDAVTRARMIEEGIETRSSLDYEQLMNLLRTRRIKLETAREAEATEMIFEEAPAEEIFIVREEELLPEEAETAEMRFEKEAETAEMPAYREARIEEARFLEFPQEVPEGYFDIGTHKGEPIYEKDLIEFSEYGQPIKTIMYKGIEYRFIETEAGKIIAVDQPAGRKYEFETMPELLEQAEGMVPEMEVIQINEGPVIANYRLGDVKFERAELDALGKAFESELNRAKTVFEDCALRYELARQMIEDVINGKEVTNPAARFEMIEHLASSDGMKLLSEIDTVLNDRSIPAETRAKLTELKSGLKTEGKLSLSDIVMLQSNLAKDLRSHPDQHTLKVELMRMLAYLKAESELLGTREEYNKIFEPLEKRLTELGHTHLEPDINEFNTMFVFSRKLGETDEGEVYGAKAVAIIMPDGRVEIRFLTETITDKHAHALKIMQEGIPSEKLTEGNRRLYIESQPDEILARTAGFQLQAIKPFGKKLKITGLQWDSQITQAQISRQLLLLRKTVDLLNDRLFESIDAELLDAEAFREIEQRTGYKVDVQYLKDEAGRTIIVVEAS